MKRIRSVTLVLLLIWGGLQWVQAQGTTTELKTSTDPQPIVSIYEENTNDVQNTNNANVKKNTQDITDAIAKQADFSFVYIPNQIYKVYCQEQRITDVQLQPGEAILYVGAGDTVRWMVDQEVSGAGETEQWHVYIKPLKSGLKTNFIINTNKHVYHLEVTATTWFTPIVNWSYPQEERAALLRQKAFEEKRDEETVGRFGLEDMSFEYKINASKSYDWKPQLIFDDGLKTYIQMPAKMKSSEAPALFIKVENELQLVNYRVKNDYYIVDRLFEEAELRNGKEIVRIKKLHKK